MKDEHDTGGAYARRQLIRLGFDAKNVQRADAWLDDDDGVKRSYKIGAVNMCKVSDEGVKIWTCPTCGTVSRMAVCQFCGTKKGDAKFAAPK